ncbi:leucine repeat adapter protein 25-like [Oppia nitens]|uniref:leucine repeat adapter protein 25-like n=1 Tax=Oppia nitens TaxID=1686743 RepID=UPI0023DC981D|nr:leucine repeat adapter protein 25-like [Oppia nitens]
MSGHQLPPLPKALTESPQQSVHALIDNRGTAASAANQYPSVGHTLVNNIGNNRLDEKLTVLRMEMISLRQLDISLLAQLQTLQQSIQNYKQLVNCDYNDYDQQNGGQNIYENCPPVRPRIDSARQQRDDNNDNDADDDDDIEDEEAGNGDTDEISDERKDSTDSLDSSV